MSTKKDEVKEQPKCRSFFDRPKGVTVACKPLGHKDEPGAQQHFEPETNINNIMKKYEETGYIPQPDQLQAVYGDFTGPTDLATKMRQVFAAEEAFANLPAKVRNRFQNDPVQLLAFLEQDQNREEAERLGLVNPRQQEPDTKEKVSVSPITSSDGGADRSKPGQ